MYRTHIMKRKSVMKPRKSRKWCDDLSIHHSLLRLIVSSPLSCIRTFVRIFARYGAHDCVMHTNCASRGVPKFLGQIPRSANLKVIGMNAHPPKCLKQSIVHLYAATQRTKTIASPVFRFRQIKHWALIPDRRRFHRGKSYIWLQPACEHSAIAKIANFD